MRQLFVVKAGTALNGGKAKPTDLSAMAEGSIGFYQLGTEAWLTDKATGNFAICYGRGANSQAIVIPEVNVKDLSVAVSTPQAGVAFAGNLTIPTPEANLDYTLVLVKKGTVFNERNTWTATYKVPANKTVTAADVAAALTKQLKAKSDAAGLNLVIANTEAKITVTSSDKTVDWELKTADDLYGVSITSTPATPPTGDKAYVEHLASMCAQNRGFNNTLADGQTIYPKYPMDVEDKTYKIYTLMFSNPRSFGKQVDNDQVRQIVYVAIPTSETTTIATLDKILKY